MSSTKSAVLAVYLLTIAAIPVGLDAAPVGTDAVPPHPVSPGGFEEILGVATACPTFSWSQVEGAGGYEVVVYALDESGETASPGAGNPIPLLRRIVPEGALSWTPPASDCLELFGRYAWAVRAVDSQIWSESRLFEVDPDPVVNRIGSVLESALERYFEARGIPPGSPGELAGLIGQELAAAAARPPAGEAPGERLVWSRGERLPVSDLRSPDPGGVFAEDVELWLEETGSGASDKVQLVFATPEFGDPTSGNAWAIVVEAYDSADPDDGTMFISTPGFADALQLFTDGTAIIGDLREFRILPSSSPPGACTSALLQGGMLYYDSDINELCDCDGSSWQQVDGGGGCS